LEAERQRQREIEGQRKQEEEAAKIKQDKFDRDKQDALRSMKGISEGKLGLKGTDAGTLGLKDFGDTGTSTGLKEIGESSQGLGLKDGPWRVSSKKKKAGKYFRPSVYLWWATGIEPVTPAV
jgi:hypothetical protein